MIAVAGCFANVANKEERIILWVLDQANVAAAIDENA